MKPAKLFIFVACFFLMAALVTITGCDSPGKQQAVEVSEIPEGMRAVELPLSQMPDKKIRPGCSVDVVVTVKLAEAQQMGESTAATMLRDIQVLAVDKSVVTLLVTTSQAKMLASEKEKPGTAFYVKRI
jgi:Flp pilus assembly protein CpaB